MDAKLIQSALSVAGQLNLKKIVMYAGGAMLLVIMALVVKKKIKEYKAEKKDDDYLKLVADSVVASDASYSEAEYYSMADALEQHFSDTGLSAGFLGVNQKGVYDVMRRMKSNTDIGKLEVAFGVRNFKDYSIVSPALGFLVKEKAYKLNEALTQLLTNGERREVNEILKENGVTYQY